MIKVNKIPVPQYQHFGPNDEFLGWLNEYENNDLRIQIVEQKAEGYYVLVDGEKVHINIDGCMGGERGWGNPYDLCEKQLAKLLDLRFND